ncbi:MAG: TonB family protein [Candidatus Obscuribacterales bacterium]
MTEQSHQGLGEVRIRFEKGWGICLDLSQSTAQLPDGIDQPLRIVSVDGTPIKGMRIDQVRGLMRGPLGSMVTLELLSTRDLSINLTLERELRRVGPATPNAVPAMLAASEKLDNFDESDFPDQYSTHRDLTKLEPYTTGLMHAALLCGEHWHERSAMTSAVQLFTVVPYYDRVGRIVEADAAASKAIERLRRTNPKTIWLRDAFFRFAEHCERKGRFHEAEAIYAYLLGSVEPVTWENSGSRADVLSRYARMLIKSGKVSEAERLFDEVADLEKGRFSIRREVADFYAERGRFNDSIQIYSDIVMELEKRSESERISRKDQPLVEALYQLGTIWQRAGDLSQATVQLQKAVSVYEARLTPSDRLELEKNPSWFPTLSDLETKLGQLHLAKGDLDAAEISLRSAITRLRAALGTASPRLKVPTAALEQCRREQAEHSESIELRGIELSATTEKVDDTDEVYQQIAYVSRMVWAAKFDVALPSIFNLLLLYEAPVDEDTPAARTNLLLNSLCVFARKLLDAGNFEEGRELLDRLESAVRDKNEPPSTLLPIITEYAVFSAEMNLPVSTFWDRLEAALASGDLDQRSEALASSYTIPERLRRWSLGYLFAGEYLRAERLLQHASYLLYKSENLQDELEVMTSTSPMLPIDLGIVHIYFGKLQEARSAINYALSFDRNSQYAIARKITHVAFALRQCGHDGEAQSLLRDAIERIPYSSLHDKRRNQTVVPALLRWKLGELLAKQGDTTQAQAELSKASNQYAERGASPLSLTFLEAELAEKQNNFAAASRMYWTSRNQPPLSIMQHQHDPARRDLLRARLSRALACADQAPNFPADETVSLILELMSYLLPGDHAHAENLLRRAAQLVPAESDIGRKVTRAMYGLTLGSQSRITEHIAACTRAAQDAEKSEQLDAYRAWLSVAAAEIRGNLPDEAITHAAHAITVFKDRWTAQSSFSPLLEARVSIIKGLREGGKSAAAERLLKQASDAAGFVYGENSYAVAASFAHLTDFYALESKKQEALEMAEHALAICRESSTQGIRNIDASGVIHVILYAATQFADGNEVEISIRLAENALSTHRACAKPDELLLSFTLSRLAHFYQRNQQNEDCDAAFREALEISRQHPESAHVMWQIIRDYATFLRAIGKSAEADELSAVGGRMEPEVPEESPAALASQAASLERIRHIDTARQLFEKAYTVSRGREPYSRHTLQALRQLIGFHIRHNDFIRVEQLYKEELELLENYRFVESYEIMECLLGLASTCARTGKTEEAKSWFSKARKSDADWKQSKNTPSSAMSIAEAAILVGHLEDAEILLDAAQKLLVEQAQSRSTETSKTLTAIADMWSKLGRTDRAEAAFALSNTHSKPVSGTPDAGSHSVQPDAPVAFDSYLLDLERRIRRCWSPPAGEEDKRIIVRFKIHRMGEISHLRIAKSSGKSSADQAALKAVERASPFRSLPSETSDDQDFEMVFEYNAAGGPCQAAIVMENR